MKSMSACSCSLSLYIQEMMMIEIKCNVFNDLCLLMGHYQAIIKNMIRQNDRGFKTRF